MTRREATARVHRALCGEYGLEITRSTQLGRHFHREARHLVLGLSALGVLHLEPETPAERAAEKQEDAAARRSFAVEKGIDR